MLRGPTRHPDIALDYAFWIAGPSLLVLAGLPWVGWALRQKLDLKFWRPRR